MQEKIKFAMYLRKSTEGAERQAESIKSQLYELDTLAKKLNLTVVEIVKEEKTARIPYNRPQFTALLKRVEAGEINGLLVWETSRLSRNPIESGMIQQLLQDGKIQMIKSMTREFVPTDNALVFGVESAFSAQFSIDQRARAKRGYRNKIREGQLAGRAHEGYINLSDGKKTWTEKDPVRFNHVRKIFDMYLSGAYTVSEIMLWLEEINYRTMKRKLVGGTPLSRSSIYKILTNPRYYGMIPNPDHPDDPDMMFKATFPTMITRDEFERIQDMLGKNGRTRYVTKKHFELKGLMRCGECGCSVTAERKQKTLKSGAINYHTYYHCTHKRPCSQKGVVNELRLFESIDDLFKQFELPGNLYDWGLKAAEHIAKQEINLRSDVEKLHFESETALKAKMDSLLDHLTDGVITAEAYTKKTKDIKAELSKRRSEHQEALKRAKNWHEVVGKSLMRMKDARRDFKNSDYMSRKEIFDAIGYNGILIDQKFELTVYEWLKPILNNIDNLKAAYQKVITEQSDRSRTVNQTKKSSEDDLCLLWQESEFVNRTFFEDNIEVDIGEVRNIIDTYPDENPGEKQC